VPKITLEKDDFVLLPEDTVLDLRVVEVDVVNRGGYDKLEFKFLITGAPDEFASRVVGTHIYGSTWYRFSMNPDNEMRQWVESLLGVELQEGFELDTELLEGRSARGVVEHYDGRYGTRAKIGALLPAPTAERPAAAPFTTANGGTAETPSQVDSLPF
jgi:hypothetical protein